MKHPVAPTKNARNFFTLVRALHGLRQVSSDQVNFSYCLDTNCAGQSLSLLDFFPLYPTQFSFLRSLWLIFLANHCLSPGVEAEKKEYQFTWKVVVFLSISVLLFLCGEY